ncbi:hypothetical protein F4X86_00370 [Candidatus Saccharibacteria bacterium]|nr:hypothetical protein [Candidatus Saccharibacteria bacterium]
MFFKNIFLPILGFLALTVTAHVLIGPQGVSAYTGEIDAADFNPGRIIDDHIFTNASSMTVEEIQRFLEESVTGGECNRYQENFYGTTDEPPYTCLFEYQQNIETGEDNYGLFTDDGAPAEVEGGSTAAEIIWQAAQDYEINPQVLLVLLQKEQSLVTDSWPWPLQYERATGYHCPDTAPCDSSAAGFYKQVAGAAWQFRKYLDDIDDFWYIIGENRILYHPNANCGHQVVDIENEATIALYLYTPYVPNQAALDNLFAVGDSCSSYGNRNFWSYFVRWFGPTTGDYQPEEEEEEEQAWAFSTFFKAMFENHEKIVAVDFENTSLQANSTAYIALDFENTGTQTWYRDEGDDQIVLVPHNPEGAASQLCNSTWQEDCQLVSLMEPEEVGPGEVGTFEFYIQTPGYNGSLTETFTLKNKTSGEFLQGTAATFDLEIVGGTDSPPPAPPSSPDDSTTDNSLQHNVIKPVENEELTVTTTPTPPPVEEPLPPTPAPQPQTVVLPDNWHELSVIEKILLNPWGCHDTTQIRADNGQCLSGGYTIPTQTVSQTPTPQPEPPTTTPPVTTTPPQTVVLPDNWHELSVIEKILLNPWGCHDTTKIRADNGQCLSGGYTIPNQVVEQAPTPPPVEEPPPPTPAPQPQTVVLPDNWHELSVIEKILLNPWGCHDTTQIRADNGQCLSGGYTIPEQN